MAALQQTRAIKPANNNWVLFAATVEAMLFRAGEKWQAERVEHAIRSLRDWYKGDGVYGDGPEFHWDYYNSFVIHPMLIEVLEVLGPGAEGVGSPATPVLARARRYAAILERLISPEGAFPPLGPIAEPTASASFICLARWRCGMNCRRGCLPPRSAAG